MTDVLTFGGSSTAVAALAFGLFTVPPTLSNAGGNSLFRTPIRSATTSPVNERRSAALSTSATTYIPGVEMLNPHYFGGESERQTSQVERTVGELRRWSALPAGWDGEDARPPVSLSIELASDFIRLLPEPIADAEPMLNTNGTAGLFWNEGNLYADLEFLGDGHIAYFIQCGNDKHKGQLHFDGEKVPPVLATLLEAPRVG